MLKLPTDKNNHGISIIEVMVAITIFSIGLLTIITAFPLALKISNQSSQTTVAINLAQAKIEEIFYLDYENVPLGTIEVKHRLANENNNPFYYYQRETLSSYVDNDLNESANETGIKKITSTVYWPGMFGQEKTTQIILLVSQK